MDFLKFGEMRRFDRNMHLEMLAREAGMALRFEEIEAFMLGMILARHPEAYGIAIEELFTRAQEIRPLTTDEGERFINLFSEVWKELSQRFNSNPLVALFPDGTWIREPGDFEDYFESCWLTMDAFLEGFSVVTEEFPIIVNQGAREVLVRFEVELRRILDAERFMRRGESTEAMKFAQQASERLLGTWEVGFPKLVAEVSQPTPPMDSAETVRSGDILPFRRR